MPYNVYSTPYRQILVLEFILVAILVSGRPSNLGTRHTARRLCCVYLIFNSFFRLKYYCKTHTHTYRHTDIFFTFGMGGTSNFPQLQLASQMPVPMREARREQEGQGKRTTSWAIFRPGKTKCGRNTRVGYANANTLQHPGVSKISNSICAFYYQHTHTHTHGHSEDSK